MAPVVRAGVAGVDSLQRGQSRVRPPSIELSACSTILVFRWDFSSLFKRGRRGGPPRREGSASLASAPNSTSSCSALYKKLLAVTTSDSLASQQQQLLFC